MKNLAPLAVVALVMVGTPAAATTLDLTTTTSTGTINGGVFTTTDNQSTGTGVIQSFVRIQKTGDEEGYNATARPVMDDVNTSPIFTRDLLLSAVSEVTLGGLVYYEFLLDINQTNANPLVSLNELQIYTRATALTTADTLAALTAAPSVLRYDLDAGAGGDSTVLLDYSKNSGSGSGDLFVYILKSAFGNETDYVYLYSQFGTTGPPYATNDGFEEWAVRSPSNISVPDGGTSAGLLGLGMLGLGYLRRRTQ